VAAAPMATRPPLPPFTRESAIQKVRLAEDGWNTRDPEKVALAYAIDSRWRNRSEFINGRNESIAFLSRKWSRELDYRLIKELWAFTGTASRYALLTSGTTTRVTGIAPMAMRTENSMTTGSWPRGLRPSTAFPFWNRIANISGRSGAGPMATQD
jgi:Protein of unknown function (DUF1348)